MKKITKFVFFQRKLNSTKESKPVSFYSPGLSYREKQCFIIPNMAEFIRDITELGNIGAIKKRLLSLNPSQIITLIWWNKTNLLNIARKDFSAGIALLIQIEVLKVKTYHPEVIILSDQLTDLAIALDNMAIVKHFVTTMHNINQKYGVMTNNFPSLLEKLSSWKMNVDYIFTSINKIGYEMNPKKNIVERYLPMVPAQKIVAIVPVFDKEEQNYLQTMRIDAILTNWF